MYFILNTYTGLSRVCPSYRILLNERVRSDMILNNVRSKLPLIGHKMDVMIPDDIRSLS